MVFLTEESGRSIGAIIAASGLSAEVEITTESIVIRLKEKKIEEKNQLPSKKKIKKAHLTKTAKKKRGNWREGEKIEFNGESLTRKEWAKKLGITESGVSYRIQTHGNPFGAKSPKPTDGDKVVAGSR